MAKTKKTSSKTKTTTSSKKKTSTKKTTTTTKATTKTNTIYTSDLSESSLEDKVDNSMRLFGIPHQFIESNDPRIGTSSNLGRCFSERIIMEAPIVALKPGVADFLPGMSDSEKESFLDGVLDAVSSNSSLSKVFDKTTEDTDDTMMYYQHKSCYSEMMAKVNVLCKLMAVFLGISDTKVPWAQGNATFGTYDWRYYTLKNQYNNVVFTNKAGSGSVGAFIKDSITAAGKSLMEDTEWIRFYVDSNTSFGESNSNSTTTSILESYTEKLEGVAKELDVISGMSGVDISEMAESASSSVDSYIQQYATGDGAIATMLSRISGSTKQIISGGNFLIPEVWSSSEYTKSYSFSITLSTPYGCPEAWYLNIGVPLMHILGLCLPHQLSANTYKSPYIVKCYSPGWFNCQLGIIDSLSIDKGSDSSWNVGGLPNEIKVSLSVKDLYSILSIPVEPYEKPSTFLSTGMLEFLMVNCGVDVTRQDMSDRMKIWATILANNFTDRFTSKPYDIQQFFKSKVQSLFNVI
jgi:hypothetical protein